MIPSLPSGINPAVVSIIADQLLSDRLREKLDGPLAHALLLSENLNLDSLDFVEIAMRIDSAFKIKLPEDVVDTWVCVGDIQRAVHAAIAEAEAPCR